MNAKELTLIHEKLTPVRYVGENACGQFLFAQGSPIPTHVFGTIKEAVEELGSAIVTVGECISSPRFHAGYNAGLFGKPFTPETRIPDGAPRELSYAERDEYTNGYIHGMQMQSNKPNLT